MSEQGSDIARDSGRDTRRVRPCAGGADDMMSSSSECNRSEISRQAHSGRLLLVLS
jgi:hypothetical protein